MAESIPVQRACALVSGLTRLADELGVSPPTVVEWKQGVRPVPEARCAQIERITAGKVTCEQLRSDVPWHRIPDPGWPYHKKGVPLIDATELPLNFRVKGEDAVRKTTARDFSSRRRAATRTATSKAA